MRIAKLLMMSSVVATGMFGMAAAAGANTGPADGPIGHMPLSQALDQFARQTGLQVVYVSTVTEGVETDGAPGGLSPEATLRALLTGTGLQSRFINATTVTIAASAPSAASKQSAPVTRLAEAAPATHAATGVETVVVTSSKIKGDIQTVPIAITALSQEQLTSRQIAGGPDLVKEVPNLTFTKTNFSGYSISIRGIGTQAISVATDPAVAVALNDIPFIRNHFFEQEFYDVNQVEVVRGPQGTLYGRNATAGVVNVISAKPTDQFEAMLSADWGNYTNRRYEGMVNIPISTDQLDLRIAGEWTKRDGYTINENTGDPVDGRDLWSSRVTFGWHPLESVQAYLVWEHFSENDDRMRTQKQLCKTDDAANHPAIANVLGAPVVDPGNTPLQAIQLAFTVSQGYLSQGCLPTSMYSKDAFEVPYGYGLPYVEAGFVSGAMTSAVDPYASAVQSPNLRVIETQIDPHYIAKNDTLEFNVDYNVTPALTFTSQTGWNEDFLWSTEDYNRFNTSPGVFDPAFVANTPRGQTLLSPYSDCSPGSYNTTPPDGTWYFDDPQVGCSNKLVAQDVSREHAWQLSQEFRIASNFTGPFNFSFGGNYMHYETVEDYFVFINALTLLAATSDSSLLPAWMPGMSDNHECLGGGTGSSGPADSQGFGYQYHDPRLGAGQPTSSCYYIDPNPLQSVNGVGHNYFRSMNPYVLNSYAGFGEAYYNVTHDVKLTAGARWTSDHKHFIDIPSELLATGYGLLPTGVVNQAWNQWTGRFAANWTPKLDFTDQTLVYGSVAHGYKAGGANPPGASLYSYATLPGHYFGPGANGIPDHPLTFKPEFIDAYELGTKNTLADGGITLNGDVFFYNYTGYQISRIVDRTAINDNFNATVRGAEIEASYEPIPGLKFNFAGGYEATRVDNGQSSIDLMDRTAGHPGWMLVKPFVTLPSNCILPDYVVAALVLSGNSEGNPAVSACGTAYNDGLDPVVGNDNDSGGYYHYNNGNPYFTVPDGTTGLDPGSPEHFYSSFAPPSGYPGGAGAYPGFDPVAGNPLYPNDPYVGQNTYNGINYGPVPNDGEGFAKNLSGHQLPNAPHFTLSLSGEYTIPVSGDWAATLHSDFYWQSQSYARIFNDNPYDKIRGYSTTNLALILTSANGWQVMGYVKNVFDVTAITGTFLNSDDSGLTTNVFLTDPRLFGVRVTKNW